MRQAVTDFRRVLEEQSPAPGDPTLAEVWAAHTEMGWVAMEALAQRWALTDALEATHRHLELWELVERGAATVDVTVPASVVSIQRAMSELLGQAETATEVAAFLQQSPVVALACAEYVGRMVGTRGRVVNTALRLVVRDGGIYQDALALFVPDLKGGSR